MQVRRLFHGVKGAARLAKYVSRREHTILLPKNWTED